MHFHTSEFAQSHWRGDGLYQSLKPPQTFEDAIEWGFGSPLVLCTSTVFIQSILLCSKTILSRSSFTQGIEARKLRVFGRTATVEGAITLASTCRGRAIIRPSWFSIISFWFIRYHLPTKGLIVNINSIPAINKNKTSIILYKIKAGTMKSPNVPVPSGSWFLEWEWWASGSRSGWPERRWPRPSHAIHTIEPTMKQTEKKKMIICIQSIESVVGILHCKHLKVPKLPLLLGFWSCFSLLAFWILRHKNTHNSIIVETIFYLRFCDHTRKSPQTSLWVDFELFQLQKPRTWKKT